MGSKVIPTPDILARAYQRAVRTKAINARLAELQADITRQPTVILTTSRLVSATYCESILNFLGMPRCGRLSRSKQGH